MKRLFVLLILGFAISAEAQRAPATKAHPYYGRGFFERVTRGESQTQLRLTLRQILQWDHRQVPNGFDEIVERCQGQGCYRHVAIGYDRARLFLMGYFYLVNQGGDFGVRDVYCEKVYDRDDFRGSDRPGPNQIPDHRVVNTEHTWPQSRFSDRHNRDYQKSDLHHLFPTDNELNSIRGNFPFGDVEKDMNGPLKCGSQARFGYGNNNGPIFEVPDRHKGNVARAMFYFAVRYDMQIDPAQEQSLRRWNLEDPVDAEEAARNEEIYKAQGNRNPFVDYPALADRIQDF